MKVVGGRLHQEVVASFGSIEGMEANLLTLHIDREVSKRHPYRHFVEVEEQVKERKGTRRKKWTSDLREPS